MLDATNVLLVAITILTGVFIWSRRTLVYWQRRRIKFVQPIHLLGNLKDVLNLKSSFAVKLRDFYFEERFADEPLIGIYLFHQPALLIRDLKLIRTVLVEDFISFSNRFAKCDVHGDKLGALNLFFVKNPEWREIRTKLAPVFTSGKIKQMFSLMEEIAKDLNAYLHKCTSDDSDENESIVQIKEICDRYTTDMIASIGFGLRTYSLRSTALSDIGVYTRQIFTITMRRALDLCVIFFLPKLVPYIRPKLFTPEHSEFLRRIVHHMIEERERTGRVRNDLIEMLITFKKEADLNQDKSHFANQEEYLAAQTAIFEIAGIEPCAATLAFALYELAKQPAVQERLRAEIETAFAECQLKGSAGMTYERILEMTYLGMVVDETLRKYPIVPILERECTPINKKRFYSFRPHVECFVRRGMPVFISNFALHYDPKYWTNPNDFDPERFSPANKAEHMVPMSYLPFGAGPHNCIGLPVALLQLKLGLIYFLRDHRIEFCSKTVDGIKFDPKFVLLSNDGAIYLKIVKTL